MFTLTWLSIPWWVSIHRICTIPGWLRTWQQERKKKKKQEKSNGTKTLTIKNNQLRSP
jgi:hypothetical protein